MWVILIPVYLQIYLVLSLCVVAYEGSRHFVKAAVTPLSLCLWGCL